MGLQLCMSVSDHPMCLQSGIYFGFWLQACRFKTKHFILRWVSDHYVGLRWGMSVSDGSSKKHDEVSDQAYWSPMSFRQVSDWSPIIIIFSYKYNTYRSKLTLHMEISVTGRELNVSQNFDYILTWNGW